MNGNSATTMTKLALLIDGDNVSATYLPLIMREAEKLGAIAVRRIYGQFKSGRMKSWHKQVEEFDLTPVNISPLTRGKNATDMRLVIEAMDMLHGRQLDGVCIASSDGDFTPLAARIRANALAVYGFGAKKAPAAYKEAFDRFFECDTLLAAEKKAPASKASPPPQKQAATSKTEPKQTAAAKPASAPKASGRTTQQAAAKPPIPTADILAAVDEVKSADGWSYLGAVGKALRTKIADFSSKKYGHATLKRLIKNMPEAELKTTSGADYARRKAG